MAEILSLPPRPSTPDGPAVAPADFLPGLLQHVASVAAGEPFQLSLSLGGRRREVRVGPCDHRGPRSQANSGPTAFQLEILAALDGRALKAAALARAVGVDKRELYRRSGSLSELRDRGQVVSDEEVGYYRPDAPPTTGVLPCPKDR
jgi:hypothetical protein